MDRDVQGKNKETNKQIQRSREKKELARITE